MSQPRQYSPTSVAQVAVNPTQFESASAATTMATKPGTTSVTMTGATGSGVKAGGSVAIAGTTLTGAVKGAEGVPTTPSKADVVKQHPAKVATTVTAPVGPSGVGSLKGPETKVQVEVAPPGAQTAKQAPVADVKPKEVPKPISTDEALDSLSFGFTTSSAPTPPKQEKKAEQFAPAPVTKSAVPPADKKAKVEKKAEQFAPAPVTKSAVPPADKTAKVEKKAEHFAPAPVTRSAVPPADKKAKDFDDFSLITGLDSPLVTKPKTDEGGFMSLDALSALGDTLGAPEPVPESPKIRPEDIVTEDPLAKTKGVLVGERDDTLPPEYRFTEDKVRNLPPPKPEPSMDSGEALDILSGDFMSPSVAHGVQAPILCPPAPPTQAKVKDSSPLSGGIVASSTASTVQAPMVPPQNKPTQVPFCTKEVTKKAPVQAAPVLISTADQDMSLDALEALGDTLGAPEPVPESPKIRPEDIVTEDPLAKTKGVLVGERDDTLPPEYRFTEDKVRNLPPLKPEPSMDSGEALDILSGDFMSPSVAHGVQAPILCPPAPPTQSSGDFALDALAGDFAAPSVAPTVKSAADRQLSTGTADALDVLSNTLMDLTPVVQPAAPVAAKDIVKEKKVTEEKVIKMGERDDSLPPEYRPTKEDKKATADAKARIDVRPKQPSMDDSTALDLLSSDFSTPAATTAVTKTTEQRQPSQVPMSGPVLDDLSDTLLPDSMTSKGGKPKSKSKSKSKSKKQREDPAALDHLSGQPSSDVVPASTNKGGKS